MKNKLYLCSTNVTRPQYRHRIMNKTTEIAGVNLTHKLWVNYFLFHGDTIALL